MEARDYERLRKLLTREIDRVVRRFAKTPENREIYVFAVWCDPENGAYGLGLNAIQDLPRGEQGRVEPGRDLATWGFGELAYNQPDFAHLWDPSPALQRGCERYRTAIEPWWDAPETWDDPEAVAQFERFTDQAVLALRDADPSLARLSQTPFFCAYVQLHDASRERQVAVARRTVSAERFDQAFPEVRLRDAEIERVRRLRAEERVRYWLRAYPDLGSWPHYGTSALGRLGVTRHDAHPEIEAIGAPAIHPALDIVESCALAPEFEEPGSPGWNEHGAFTREATTTHALLLCLMEIRGADARARARVEGLLRRLVGENRARPRSGLNPSLLARTLHAWFPEAYPSAQTSAETNHLLNAASFASTP